MLRSIRRLRPAPSSTRLGLLSRMGQFLSSSAHDHDDSRLYDWNLNRAAYESTAAQTMSSDNSIRLVTFNLLAPCYKRLDNRDQATGRKLREAHAVESWSPRAKETLSFFQREFFCNGNGYDNGNGHDEGHESASIIALQEFWQDADYLTLFTTEFTSLGYTMAHKTRSGGKTDAVALLVKDSIFEVLDTQELQLITGGDRVAILMFLRHRLNGEYFLIANTHLSFPHTAFDRMLQVQQIASLTQTIKSLESTYMCKIKAKGKTALTTIVTGDFNAEARSQVCNHMKECGYVSCFDVTPPQIGQYGSSSDDIQYENDDCNRNHKGNRMRLFSGESDLASPTPSQNDTHFTFPADDIHNNNGNNNKDEKDPGTDLDTRVEGEGEEGVERNWVSHYTHLQEELGVDHIFIKRSDSAGDGNDTSTSSNGTSSNGTSSNGTSSNGTSTGNEEHSVFVRTCSVLPLSLPARRWNSSFTISDHRPVSTSLVMVPEAMKKAV